MKPASGTVSASSLLIWDQCPQKWAAEYVDYIPKPQGSTRAAVGTVCHAVAENFVVDVYINKTHDWNDKDHLLALHHQAFIDEFHVADSSMEEYTDSRKLTVNWWERTDLSDVEIISTEKKTRTPTQVDDILLTYIFDRCDLIEGPDGERAIRVVDYKSVAERWSVDDVATKKQFRIYAMCAMIEFKHLKPEGVWVVADLLRHNELVGHYITRAECEQTWRELKQTVQNIVAMPREKAPYKLGVGCRFCPIQSTCPKLKEHVDKGGILSIMNEQEALLMYGQLKGKKEALESLMSHCEDVISNYARETEVTKITATDDDGQVFTVDVTAQGRRGVSNQPAIAKIVGPQIAARIGKFNMADLDGLLKGDEIDDSQKRQIQSLINKKYSPKLKFKQKGQ